MRELQITATLRYIFSPSDWQRLEEGGGEAVGRGSFHMVDGRVKGHIRPEFNSPEISSAGTLAQVHNNSVPGGSLHRGW